LGEEKGLIRRLAYRFVRRHTAGYTVDSAIKTALDLNKRGYKATITFLNESAKDSTKAKYNINTYLHIMRQISRLRINADVSMRASQIGWIVGRGTFEKGLGEISSSAKQLGVKAWIEYENEEDMPAIYESSIGLIGKHGGFEIPALSQEKAQFKPLSQSKSMVKLNFNAPPKEEKPKGSRFHIRKSATSKEHAAAALWFIKNRYNVVGMITESGLAGKLSSNLGSYKKHLIFEILLGYEGKRPLESLKGNGGTSVYMPYGKDWVPYAISRLTDGRLRNLAIRVLDGKELDSA
jgi:proline dehydrogenase